jgi:lysophospholipase L1-like esterase
MGIKIYDRGGDSIPEFPVYTEEESSEKEIVSNPIQPRQTTQIIPTPPKVQVDTTTDSRIFLSAFYDALDNADEELVRVLHYGDSQIEEDRISQQIREALQARFGGRGVGMMPLAQTIPTLTVKQELRMSGRRVQPTQGPKRYLIYSFKRDQRPDGLYGPLGQMAEMNDSLVSGSEQVTAICKPIVSTAQYDQWRVFADTTIRFLFNGDSVRLTGKGNVYALSQQSRTGVIVDNIPMRGCLGLVFTKIDRDQLVTFYREQDVRLIIMQFGGNAIPSNRNATTIQSIVRGLRDQVRYLQACAPDADILFIGPSDMLTQTDGEWRTYPMVPYMDKLLRKMALEENIAYFSLYRWMGGSGSMIRWQEAGLAGTDGVHFTRAGAKKAGKAIANWILKGFEKQKTLTDLPIDQENEE